MATFCDSPTSVRPPPLSARPTVLQCLYAARFFDESRYPRPQPPPVDPAVVANETPAARAKRQNPAKYRTTRENQPRGEQREEFFTKLLRKAEAAIARGDVHPLPNFGGGRRKLVLKDKRPCTGLGMGKLRNIMRTIIILIILLNPGGVEAKGEFHFPHGPVFGAKAPNTTSAGRGRPRKRSKGATPSQSDSRSASAFGHRHILRARDKRFSRRGPTAQANGIPGGHRPLTRTNPRLPAGLTRSDGTGSRMTWSDARKGKSKGC